MEIYDDKNDSKKICMRQYTMDDIRFNPEPLTLFEPDPNYKPNEEELE